MSPVKLKSARVRNKRWREKHPGSRALSSRRFHLKSYGLTLEQHASMLAEQGGLCAICRCPPADEKKPLHIDHDHKTGKVRALLCSGCNTRVAAHEHPLSLATRQYIKEHE